jgi:recombination protein U
MSLGKNFETICAVQLQEQGFYVQRLPDQMTFLKGSKNPCDYIVYKYPYMFLAEMKTTAGSSMPLKNISEFQLKSLNDAFLWKGVIGLFLIWFYDKGVTVAVLGDDIAKLNKKSIRYDDEICIVIEGKKKHKYFEYNFTKLFAEVKKKYESRIKANRRKSTNNRKSSK